MTECPQEPFVCRAAAEDRWTDALRQHVSGCTDCAAAAAAAPFMARFARLDERQHALPDPSVLWLKAQILGGAAAADRATAPLQVVQLVAYAVVAIGWAAVLTWKWTDLQNWALGFTPSHVVQGLSTGGAQLSISFLGVVVLLATITVVLGLHTILAED